MAPTSNVYNSQVSGQIKASKTVRKLIRRRGPNTSQPSTTSTGTTM